MSTKTEQVPASLLEEMLEDEVPCGGVRALGIPPCGKTASWRRARGHTCPDNGDHPASFKCNECYMRWHVDLMARYNFFGYIRCIWCNGRFPDLNDFVRYIRI